MTAHHEYELNAIVNRLADHPFCMLATHCGEEINARAMLFGCAEDGRTVYLLTHGQTNKVRELAADPTATVSVLLTAEELDDHAEATLQGSVETKNDINDPEVRAALDVLGKKSALVRNIQAGGSLGEYVVLALRVGSLSFRVYEDILNNVPATVHGFRA